MPSPPLHIEPPTIAEHGTDFAVRDMHLHGIADVDALRVQTQRGNMPGTGKKWWATYRRFVAERIHFGSCWRTPEGAAKGLHVDRFQALGVPGDADDRAKHVTGFSFLECTFDNSGDPMPAGCMDADTCLLQEIQSDLIEWKRCSIGFGLAAAKITLRRDWCYAKVIRIIDSPNFRLFIDAVNLGQVDQIYVENSPGFILSDAKKIGLKSKIVTVTPDPCAKCNEDLKLAHQLATESMRESVEWQRKLEAATLEREQAMDQIMELVKKLKKLKG